MRSILSIDTHYSPSPTFVQEDGRKTTKQSSSQLSHDAHFVVDPIGPEPSLRDSSMDVAVASIAVIREGVSVGLLGDFNDISLVLAFPLQHMTTHKTIGTICTPTIAS